MVGLLMTGAMKSPARPGISPAVFHNPFDDELAQRHSHYYGTKAGRAISLGEPDQTPDLFASAAVGAFRGFVLNPDFSCVGAKSAVMNETYRVGIYDQICEAGSTAGLARDLFTFAREAEQADEGDFMTFVAMFKGPAVQDECEFERSAVGSAPPAQPARCADPWLGLAGEQGPGRSSLRLQLRRECLLHRRPPPAKLPRGPSLPLADPGLQPPCPVRAPQAGVGRWERLQHGDPGQREEQSARLAQPEPGRLRHRHRGPAVFGPGGRARLAPPVRTPGRRPTRPSPIRLPVPGRSSVKNGADS